MKFTIIYLFLRANNNAVPANMIIVKPTIGTTSPVFAAFALVVVISCPVWVVFSSVDGISFIPSTATKLSIALCTLVTAASTSFWLAFSFSRIAFASATAAVSAA